MNVIIEIGNTRSKYAIFDGEMLVESGVTLSGLAEKLAAFRSAALPVEMLVAGTGLIREEVIAPLRRLATTCYQASPDLSLPITIGYDTPATLGFDRVAGSVAGASLYPGRPLLIIDTGTAVTFDYVSRDGMYLGGNISPGLSMRYRSLHVFTNGLPLVENAPEHGDLGKSTVEAIRNGVLKGFLFEMRGYMDAFAREHPEGIILLTGGDGEWLNELIDRPVVQDKYLVMKGLNLILSYQKEKKSCVKF